MAKRNIEKHIRFNEKEDEIIERKASKIKVSVCEYIRRMAVNDNILRYELLSLHDNLISFRTEYLNETMSDSSIVLVDLKNIMKF